MHVRVLSIRNFRNLDQVLLQPHPRFNVLYGDNGQGKTNILEAIYLMASLRSFRTAAIDELIRFGQRVATIGARVERQGVERLLEVQLTGDRPARKTALVDGKTARSGDYFGGVNAVVFAPEDLRLPKGPPVQRRRFLDRAVWNTCPVYLREVQTYERVLRNRNALLRKLGPAGQPSSSEEDLLTVYDQQLATSGAVLVARRSDYVVRLAPRAADVFTQVSRSGLGITLRYRATQELLEQLTRDRRRDLYRGYTHSGPHTDDLELDLDGRPVSLFASQGQTRALVLALKIAEITHLNEILGDAPVLLLDDVSSELDPSRNAYLFEFLRQVSCQAFITTTSPEHIQLFENRQDFEIISGTICASS